MMCSIPGCGDIVLARGWCRAHYWRWHRHGDPLGGRTPRGEAARYFREVVLIHDSNECLIWPYADDGNGYAVMRLEGNLQYVSRVVCREVHGEPPTPEHEAAHSCNRGQFGCVAKGHLDWKTHAENMSDMLTHGTSTRGEQNAAAKLTEPEAREILALKGRATQSEIGERFGVDGRTVGNIHRRVSWAWL